jgi:hypothetical protein
VAKSRQKGSQLLVQPMLPRRAAAQFFVLQKKDVSTVRVRVQQHAVKVQQKLHI